MDQGNTGAVAAAATTLVASPGSANTSTTAAMGIVSDCRSDKAAGTDLSTGVTAGISATVTVVTTASVAAGSVLLSTGRGNGGGGGGMERTSSNCRFIRW